MATLNLKGMTIGEKLFIFRRRSNESQEKAAQRFGMNRNTYGRMERDDDDSYSNITPPEFDELTQEEICVLLRRRAGLTQEECAHQIGVTRFWFNRMEAGQAPSSSLIKFWNSVV